MKTYTQADFSMVFVKEIEGRKRKSSDQIDRCGLFKCTKCGDEMKLVLSSATRKQSGLCRKCSIQSRKPSTGVIEELTQSILKSKFSYDMNTGEFTRLTNGRKTIGTVDKNGYVIMSIGHKRYQAHRLAWLYVYGYLPTQQLDHKDHNRSNNSIDNLREVTELENSKSKRLYRSNTSGQHGVIWNPINKNWRARIGLNGKTINLGTFEEKGDAIAARKAAEHEYGFHENHGIGKVGDTLPY